MRGCAETSRAKDSHCSAALGLALAAVAAAHADSRRHLVEIYEMTPGGATHQVFVADHAFNRRQCRSMGTAAQAALHTRCWWMLAGSWDPFHLEPRDAGAEFVSVDDGGVFPLRSTSAARRAFSPEHRLDRFDPHRSRFSHRRETRDGEERCPHFVVYEEATQHRRVAQRN